MSFSINPNAGYFVWCIVLIKMFLLLNIFIPYKKSSNILSNNIQPSENKKHRYCACCLLPAACCLLPAACCLLPAACCLLPAACCLLPAACCLLPAACCPLPTAHCPLPTAHCPLPTAHCPLPTAHCPLSTIHSSLPFTPVSSSARQSPCLARSNVAENPSTYLDYSGCHAGFLWYEWHAQPASRPLRRCPTLRDAPGNNHW